MKSLWWFPIVYQVKGSPFKPAAKCPMQCCPNISTFDSFYSFNIYLFICLHRVLAAAGGLRSCGMRTLSCDVHVGSSALTRDRTWAPCIGSAESSPLCHQGSPLPLILALFFLVKLESLLPFEHSPSCTFPALPLCSSLPTTWNTHTAPICPYSFSRWGVLLATWTRPATHV